MHTLDYARAPLPRHPAASHYFSSISRSNVAVPPVVQGPVWVRVWHLLIMSL